ncbi:MAG: S4 domain-containing protein, partial [Pseudomonadota bacterium]
MSVKGDEDSPVRELSREWVVPFEMAGRRLDQVLSEVWNDYSRSRLADWIRSGDLTVEGRKVKAKHSLTPGERVRLECQLEAHPDNPQPQAIDLDILIDDPALFVINKPPGMVV